MIAESFLEQFAQMSAELKLPFNADDMKSYMIDCPSQPEDLDIIHRFLNAMVRKKRATAIATLKRLSRIPQKSPSTFDNFDMDRLCAEARKQVNSLKALPFISAKRNVIMIGPTGTGKTHLAMAIGNQCCDNNMKAYFIKMGELKEKFHNAILAERQGKYLSGLSKYSCLIIDEIGYCHFDKAETLMFFQLIDRINLKETGSIVLTSNKDTVSWQELFEEDDALECTMDRLCDTAICLTFSGCSYRGKGRERINLDFQKLR